MNKKRTISSRLTGYYFKMLIISISAMIIGCSSLPGLQKDRIVETSATDGDRLRREVHRWRGTPYRFGGMSRNGIDCSGFAVVLYRDVFGIDLPRTTEEQIKLGKPVPLKLLEKGDLIFFLPESKNFHLGIYLGNGEFAHASTSNGVMVSSLDVSYWTDIFLTARRLVDQ